MEKRLGIVALIVENNQAIPQVNALLSRHALLINARMGLPLRAKGISLISLVVEGSTDDIGALTGQLGRLAGVKVKSVLTNFREDDDDRNQEQPHFY